MCFRTARKEIGKSSIIITNRYIFPGSACRYIYRCKCLLVSIFSASTAKWMKRLQTCLGGFFLLVALTSHAVDIYVSPNGSDTNDGSRDKPFATLSMALRKARELRRLNDASITSGIHIILRGGSYQLSETILIHPEDGAESPTFIESSLGERAVLSGGGLVK